MESYAVTRTQYKVADFIGWQRDGLLDLSPNFQRRSVWKPGAKSLLIDSVIRNLPTPIIFLRDRVDLDSLSNRREVVDGQQRLRTLIAYIAPDTLADRQESDDFSVRRVHNHELAGKSFDQLPEEWRMRLLNYEFSTHVLPSELEDRDILMLFARLNATGERLSPQELRNAEFFGECKTLMYELALEQLTRWKKWNVFTGDDLARMKEVELTSDMVDLMLNGFSGKSQARLKRLYRERDDDFPERDEVARRYRGVMDAIDHGLGPKMAVSAFSNEIWFQVLFYAVYRDQVGAVPFDRSPKVGRISPARAQELMALSDRIGAREDLPADVLEAATSSSSDAKHRQHRLDFLVGG